MDNRMIDVSALRFTDEQIDDAHKKLDKYVDLVKNNNRVFGKAGISLSITDKEFTDLSLKRTNLKECKIKNTIFNNCALTDSRFEKADFSGDTFRFSNLQHCRVSDSLMDSVRIESTNCSDSNFYRTELNNVSFGASTMSQILFEDCVLSDCSFESSAFENTLFLNCSLKNVCFKNSNLEYVEFINIKAENVTFPFFQIPYTFGGMQLVADGKISADADCEILSEKKYYSLLKDLIVYFSTANEYFPMANIYSFLNKGQESFDCICAGLKESVVKKDFRMMKFYCKIAAYRNLFSAEKLRLLYDHIEKCAAGANLTPYETRDFSHNIGEIKSLILDNVYGYPYIAITISTDIDSSETEKTADVLAFLDNTIETVCTKKAFHIEYRHNSPVELITYVSAHHTEILAVLDEIRRYIPFAILAYNAYKSMQLKQLEIDLKTKETERGQRETRLDSQGTKLEVTNIFIINN
ncbi:hypothetical protein FACS1894188_12370 [Clostridia bacterium]|nr:hypothetical protein FACS1894188_12370 [Clostridia bacterium]